ncbi:MAG: 2OG-Fe(II) oxygenase [Ferruginibacter sp.]|nr:2OG-Fe(II) oxygenase [Ferruginibacter sp.]
MNMKFDQLIDSYLENKVGITENFMSEELCDGLRQNIITLEEDNQLRSAGIGNEENDGRQKMRSDRTYWMDKTHPNQFEQEFLQLAEDFIGRLNDTCYAGINDYEFHYAVYDEGAYYHKHRDQFKSDDQRKYSFINYLNRDWLDEDGGHLLVYPGTDVQKILPEARTAVFFKSDEMEHEVTLAHRRRSSISGWLKRV